MKKTVYMIIFDLIAILLCGCSTESFHMEEVRSNELTFYMADHSLRTDEPVIILCHGLGGDHEDLEATAEMFYRYGYAVVTLDLYGHEGISYDSDAYISDMILRSAEKIESILDVLQGSEQCGIEKWGLYGYSMGGMIGYYMAAFSEKKPDLLISMASLPDFEVILENASDYMPLKYSAEKWRFEYITPEENSELQEWAKEHNPVRNMEELSEVSVIMVNGGADDLMPVECAEQFQEDMTEAGGTVQLYVNPEGTHGDLGDYHIPEIMETASSVLPTG